MTLKPTRTIKTWGGIDFVRIPKGLFIMGSKEDNDLAWSDEFPQHAFEIPYEYWVGRFPVSNAQFEGFAVSTTYETRAEREGWAWVWDTSAKKWKKTEGANWKHPLGTHSDLSVLMEHPVVQVSFYDAVAFCEWMNQDQIEDLLEGYHFSLPSEPEWENAGRGPDGREFPWGNDFDPLRCNSIDGGKAGTVHVGCNSPEGDSVYGAADMSGNVWEWTITLWGEDRDNPAFVYPYNPKDGREKRDAGDSFFRIIRGGSFKDNVKGVRSAVRDLDPPYFSLNNLGFRVFVVPKIK
jgi:sulfatase modifying factor 1